MREIKFQSIHRHYKEGDVIFSEWGPQNGLFVAPTSISGYTLEGHRQYTGLKDKNGKEIYEGDVLQYKVYHVHKRWWSRLEDIPVIEQEVSKQKEDIYIEKSTVKFRHGQFQAGWLSGEDIDRGNKMERGTSGHGYTECKRWDFEVIGNIYQNPELL